ncbi:MAG: sensor histidine kinase [Lachnospiraceae bacterium]
MKQIKIKKVNFIKLFLFRLTVILLILLAVCMGITYVARHEYNQEKDLEAKNSLTLFQSGIYEKYNTLQSEGKRDEKLLDEFTNDLQWYVDSASFCLPAYLSIQETTAFAIYNKDTKELYAISDENAYIFISDYKGLDGFFRYEGNHMKEFEKLYKKMGEIEEAEYGKEFPYSNAYYKYVMDGIYVTDHNTFTPKNIRLVKYDSYTNEELETILAYNMEPDEPSDYTYIPIDASTDRKVSSEPVLLGFELTGKDNAKSKMLELLDGKSGFGDDLNSILEDDCYSMGWSDDDGTRIEATRMDVGNMTLEVIVCNTWDFWAAKGYSFIKLYVVVGLFGLLVVFVWTIYTYKMKKGYYELDRYRKHTTNTLAHDLKTPLTAILGYTENLQNDTHPEKNSYYLQSIHSNVEYMNGLIEKVLALGKVEEAGYEICKEEFEISDMLHEVSKKYDILMGERDLQIEVSGNATVVSDKVLFTQILDNLIGNGVKYALPGTVIDISVNGKKITFTNQMETPLKQSTDELLKPFVKGDDSRGGITGSGLGLTIVNNIVKLLKYKMTVFTNENEFIIEIDL